MSIKSEILDLCKREGIKGGIEAEIRIASNGEDHDKNRLVAILFIDSKKSCNERMAFMNEPPIKEALESLQKTVASYQCKRNKETSVTRGLLIEIFFLAKGWPKFKKKLNELGIKYELQDRLDPKEIDSDDDINDYLLPSSQKIFGFKPEK